MKDHKHGYKRADLELDHYKINTSIKTISLGKSIFGKCDLDVSHIERLAEIVEANKITTLKLDGEISKNALKLLNQIIKDGKFNKITTLPVDTPLYCMLNNRPHRLIIFQF